MSYSKLVYKIGKQYGDILGQSVRDEYPTFIGHIADLLDETEIANLPELIGEYVIGYTNLQGVRHYLRVYFDEGEFEVAGTPMSSDDYSLSSDIQPQDQ